MFKPERQQLLRVTDSHFEAGDDLAQCSIYST